MSEKPPKTYKILVVDDDENVLDIVRTALRRAKFEVVTAETMGEALRALRDEKPDLVILDVMLPEVSGFDICKKLKRDPDTAHIPVIMLTAMSKEVDRIVGLELGADDYVVKPFVPKELVLRIKAILRRNVPQPPGDEA